MTTIKLKPLYRMRVFFEKHPSFKAVALAAGFIIFLFLIFHVNEYFKAPAHSYAISYGIVFGLLSGLFLQSKSSSNIKFGTVGIFGGMGLDLFASTIAGGEGNKAITAINSLGTFVGNQWGLLIHHTSAPEVVDPIKLKITLGLWVTILVIALVIICASFFPQDEQPVGE